MHAIISQTLVHSGVKFGGNQIRKLCLKAIPADLRLRAKRYIPDFDDERVPELGFPAE